MPNFSFRVLYAYVTKCTTYLEIDHHCRAQAAAVARTRSRVVEAPRQGGLATRQRRCSGFGGCLRFLFLSLAFGQKLGAVWSAAQQGGAPHQTILYTMAEKRPKRKLLFWLETVVFGEDG